MAAAGGKVIQALPKYDVSGLYNSFNMRNSVRTYNAELSLS